jgi:hypothetical protein
MVANIATPRNSRHHPATHSFALHLQIANLRRIEIIEAAAQCVPTGDQLYRSTNNEPVATSSAAAAPPTVAGSTAATPSAAGGPHTTEDGDAANTLGLNRTLGASSMVGGTLDSSAAAAASAGSEAAAVLAAVGSGVAGSCKAAALLYSELDVTHPTRKLTQAELYRRMVWELKTQ